MDAQAALSAEVISLEESGCPFKVGRGQEHLHLRPGQPRLTVEQLQEPGIVFDAVKAVVLRERAVDQEAVQRAVPIVAVAEPERGAEKHRRHAIMDPSLGMGVHGQIVGPPPQLQQVAGGLQTAVLDQIPLVDAVEVRVALQKIARTRPEDQGLDLGLGVLKPEFVHERGGDQTIANACQRYDQYSHLSLSSRPAGTHLVWPAVPHQ